MPSQPSIERMMPKAYFILESIFAERRSERTGAKGEPMKKQLESLSPVAAPRLVVPLIDFERIELGDQFWVVLEIIVNPVLQDVRREKGLASAAHGHPDVVAGLANPLLANEKDDSCIPRVQPQGFGFTLQVTSEQIALWWSQTLEDFELGVLRNPVSYVVPHGEGYVTCDHGRGKNEQAPNGHTEVRIVFVRRVPAEYQLWEKPENAGRDEQAKPRLRRLLDKFTKFRKPVHFGISFLHNVKCAPTPAKEVTL